MAGCLNPIRTVENSINGAVRIGTTVRNLVPDKPKPEEEKKEPGEGASRAAVILGELLGNQSGVGELVCDVCVDPDIFWRDIDENFGDFSCPSDASKIKKVCRQLGAGNCSTCDSALDSIIQYGLNQVRQAGGFCLADCEAVEAEF